MLNYIKKEKRYMKHLIDIKDLTVNEIDELIEVAKDIIANDLINNKIKLNSY